MHLASWTEVAIINSKSQVVMAVGGLLLLHLLLDLKLSVMSSSQANPTHLPVSPGSTVFAPQPSPGNLSPTGNIVQLALFVLVKILLIPKIGLVLEKLVATKEEGVLHGNHLVVVRPGHI